LRTATLLAGLTALLMAIGYLIGGGTGAVIALLFAAATNMFSYGNSNKLVAFATGRNPHIHSTLSTMRTGARSTISHNDSDDAAPDQYR
jgi:hypothetical protein